MIHLIARWAKGALARQDGFDFAWCSSCQKLGYRFWPVQERKIGSHDDELERNSHEAFRCVSVDGSTEGCSQDGHDGQFPEDNEGHDGRLLIHPIISHAF